METQRELVLNHLQQHGSITSMEAFQLFGVTRLSAIIYELRHKEDYKVLSVFEVVTTRQGCKTAIARYVLGKEN